MANSNGFIKMAMGALVVVLVAAGVIMPILASAEQTHATFTNDGYYRMSETSEKTVIVWDSSDTSILTVNGDEVSLDSIIGQFNTSYSIAFADDFILRFFNQSTTIQSIQLWNSDYVAGVVSSEGYKLTVTLGSDGITWITTDNTNTEVANNTYAHSGSYFTINDTGNYVMKYKDGSAYVNSTSTIVYAGGISSLAGSTYSGIYFEGTIDNLAVTVMNSYVTVSDVAATYTEDENYLDLALLDKVTFTTTFNGTDKAQTYNFFLVPYQVTAELADHPTGTVLTLIQILPVLIMVGVLMFIVSAFISNRRA